MLLKINIKYFPGNILFHSINKTNVCILINKNKYAKMIKCNKYIVTWSESEDSSHINPYLCALLF